MYGIIHQYEKGEKECNVACFGSQHFGILFKKEAFFILFYDVYAVFITSHRACELYNTTHLKYLKLHSL